MLLLAINTLAEKNAVALCEKKGSALKGSAPKGSPLKANALKILAQKNWQAKKNESEKVLPVIEELLKKTDKKVDAIEGIIVVDGPGGFTRIRIGVTIANAFSYGLKVPIYAIHADTLKHKKNFGESLKTMNIKTLKAKKQVSPFYDRPPNISVSSSPLTIIK